MIIRVALLSAATATVLIACSDSAPAEGPDAGTNNAPGDNNNQPDSNNNNNNNNNNNEPEPPPLPPAAATYTVAPGFFQAVIDAERHQVFLSYGGDKRVDVVDLFDGSITSVDFDYNAEHMYFDATRDEVVVSLPTQAHSSYWFDDQEGYVSAIDAEELTAATPIAIALDPWQVVSDGAGTAYVMGASGQWTDLAIVDLDSGEHALQYGPRELTRAQLHPDGDRIYGADVGLSPSDIERYTIAEGSITDSYDSPYHGDYPMCGDLRIHPGGTTIYTRCGHVFLASNTKEQDMTWTGDLGITWLDLTFSADGSAGYLLESGDDDPEVLTVIDPAELAAVDSIPIAASTRVLMGTDYVVLIGNVLGGDPKTRLEVLPVTRE